MKTYTWNVTAPVEIPIPDMDDGLFPEEASAPEVPAQERIYRVTYNFSRLRGRITLAVDGNAFELPAGFLGLKAARREIFRLGGEQAILVVTGSGRASLIFRGQTV